MSKINGLHASVFALAAAAALSSCGLGDNMKKSLKSGLNDPGITQGPGSVGIKTAATLVASLEAVTGVPATTITSVQHETGTDNSLPLNRHVELSMTFLSKSSELGSLNNTHVLVATSLGSAFAREQIRREAGQAAGARALCGDVDFSRRPAEALTDAVVGKLIDKFARRYVQRAPAAEEVTALKQCVVGIVGDLGTPGSAAANSVANQQAISACIATAYLGSPDFLRQ